MTKSVPEDSPETVRKTRRGRGGMSPNRRPAILSATRRNAIYDVIITDIERQIARNYPEAWALIQTLESLRARHQDGEPAGDIPMITKRGEGA